MTIESITAKTLLRKPKYIDSWFLSSAYLNIYQGCSHGCLYCDGRAEQYHFQGNFQKDIKVKINAATLLEKEIMPNKRRKAIKPGFIMLGGGICDSYQPLEAKYNLSRNCLEILKQYKKPVHILTKSAAVKKDLPLLADIAKNNSAILSMSISSVDDTISSFFEPHASPPSQRLEVLAQAKKLGIHTGIFLMPILPYFTDIPEQLEKTIATAQQADFIIFGGLTLKPGRQRAFYYDAIKPQFPKTLTKYTKIYGENKWGCADNAYYRWLNTTVYQLTNKYKVACRIPPLCYQKVLPTLDKIIIALEHLDYISSLQERSSLTRYAIRKIRQAQHGDAIIEDSNFIKGLNKTSQKVIHEISQTGTCKLLNQYLHQSL